MKLRFKVQPYQTDAVDAVVDCFAGQPPGGDLRYRIDPGAGPQPDAFDEGFRNADIRLPDGVLLELNQSSKISFLMYFNKMH